MTTELEKICTVEYIESLLNKYVDVDELIEKLVLKAHDEAPNIESLKKLEGESITTNDLVLLKKCPMANIIKQIKEKNLQETGKREFPPFYKKIIMKYKEKYPDEAGILHPFCIIHQSMREIIADNKHEFIRHIACKSSDTGELAVSKNGLKQANISLEKLEKLIEEHACAYLKRNFASNED